MHISNSSTNVVSHDPTTHIVEQPKLPPKKNISVVVLIMLGFILIVVGLVWYLNGQSFDFSRQDQSGFIFEPIDESIVAVVGSENIFAEDIKYEQSFYPEDQQEEQKENIKQRLIEESIILQAGADAHYIQLSENVFNSVHKNRENRRQLLTTVEQAVNNNAATKKGAIVSIWFMNFEPGSIGYDAGKALALEKITSLHQAVQNGQMTIKQAGDAIKNDSSLAQVDRVYANNAYAEFDTKLDDSLTYDPTFNEIILSLSQGEVSELYTGQDYEKDFYDQPKKDAVFMFARMNEIKAEGDLPFQAWLSQQKQNYAVTEL